MKQKADGDWKHEKAVIFESIREVPWSLVRHPITVFSCCEMETSCPYNSANYEA